MLVFIDEKLSQDLNLNLKERVVGAKEGWRKASGVPRQPQKVTYHLSHLQPHTTVTVSVCNV